MSPLAAPRARRAAYFAVLSVLMSVSAAATRSMKRRLGVAEETVRVKRERLEEAEQEYEEEHRTFTLFSKRLEEKWEQRFDALAALARDAGVQNEEIGAIRKQTGQQTAGVATATSVTDIATDTEADAADMAAASAAEELRAQQEQAVEDARNWENKQGRVEHPYSEAEQELVRGREQEPGYWKCLTEDERYLRRVAGAQGMDVIQYDRQKGMWIGDSYDLNGGAGGDALEYKGVLSDRDLDRDLVVPSGSKF